MEEPLVGCASPDFCMNITAEIKRIIYGTKKKKKTKQRAKTSEFFLFFLYFGNFIIHHINKKVSVSDKTKIQ